MSLVFILSDECVALFDEDISCVQRTHSERGYIDVTVGDSFFKFPSPF